MWVFSNASGDIERQYDVFERRKVAGVCLLIVGRLYALLRAVIIFGGKMAGPLLCVHHEQDQIFALGIRRSKFCQTSSLFDLYYAMRIKL